MMNILRQYRTSIDVVPGSSMHEQSKSMIALVGTDWSINDQLGRPRKPGIEKREALA